MCSRATPRRSTGSNWSLAQAVDLSSRVPAAAGGTETFTAAGLLSGQLTYFGLRSMDGVGNLSAVSNVPSPFDSQAPLSTRCRRARAPRSPGPPC